MMEHNTRITRFIERWEYYKRFDCEVGGLSESIEELKDCFNPENGENGEVSTTTYILTNEDQSVPLYMLWNGNIYKVENVK